MPRNIRGDTAHRIFHIINRGVERRTIFLKAEDFGFFLSQARETFTNAGISLLSYVLMPNHFHFLAEVGAADLSATMQNLQGRYSMYFNRIYERVGHLFQDRFKSFEVEDREYLEWLPVYIHRNPVKAGLVTKPGEWRWSGHDELLSSSRRYLDLARLNAFGFDENSFKASYRAQLVEFERPLSIDAGLSEIVRWCAKQCGVRWQDLVAGERGGPYTRAKLLILSLAQARGHTLSEVAKHLGCSPAAMSGLRESGF